MSRSIISGSNCQCSLALALALTTLEQTVFTFSFKEKYKRQQYLNGKSKESGFNSESVGSMTIDDNILSTKSGPDHFLM